jgi:hypothetical protein
MALPQAAAHRDLERVRATYGFADEREVTTFLNEHPFLIPIIEEARVRIAAQFGPDTKVRLEPWTDPEDGDRVLVAFIEAERLPVQETETRFWAFVDDWPGRPLSSLRPFLRFDVE